MLWILIRKEFLDMVRDRRALITSFVVPLLLFPVMMIVIGGIAASTDKKAKEKIIRVALISRPGAEAFRKMLLQKGPLLTRKGELTVREDLTFGEGRRLIEADSLDVMVYFDPEFDRLREAGLPGRVSVYFKRTEDAGKEGQRKVVGVLKEYRDLIHDNRLAELGVDPVTTLRPIEINEFNLASDRERFAGIAGRFLPYFFIMFSIMGVMHPATDLAAGEKERGTLETLFTIPTTRFRILFAKFLVVVTSGLVSGLVTMGSLYVGVRFMGARARMINKAVGNLLEPTTIVAVFSLIVPLTVFFAAIAMTISVFAKSFKEAQSLLAPLMVVAILPLAASLAPGIQLSPWNAWIPILNVSLAIKALLGETGKLLDLAMVYGSLCVAAMVGVWFCAKMFNREGTVFRT